MSSPPPPHTEQRSAVFTACTTSACDDLARRPRALFFDAAGAALFNSLHPRCIDRDHVRRAGRVAGSASGMQDRDGAAAAAARFEAARIDGGALLRLNGSALRDELAAAAVVRTLEPWLISLRTDAGEARWSTGELRAAGVALPGVAQALGGGAAPPRLWADPRGQRARQRAQPRRPPLAELDGRPQLSRGFQGDAPRPPGGAHRRGALHRALQHAPRCDSNNCEMLLPLHAGVRLPPPPRVARPPPAARRRQPVRRDVGDPRLSGGALPADIFLLKSVADECADAPAYDYPELPEWVELGRGKREL